MRITNRYDFEDMYRRIRPVVGIEATLLISC